LTGLTKKNIRADKNLSAIIGVEEGTLTSYAEIQKGLHEYIRRNNLRVEATKPRSVQHLEEPEAELEQCYSCGAAIPRGSAYCDQCGAEQ
jgi:hypothetical protein